MFTHLNTHSTYSKLQGAASPREILTLAQNYQMPCLALTEVNGIWGFIRFVQSAKEYGILPICGVNLITDTDDIILLTENQIGYENLCRVISLVHDNAHQSLTDLLSSRCSGLFILAHRETALDTLSQFIPDTHLFVELRPGMEELTARRMSQKFNLEMVVTGDVYFLNQEDQPVHRILRAIDHNSTLSQLPPETVKGEQHYFRSEREMIQLFPNSLDAIDNSHYLAERCKTDWSFVNTVFPGMSLKDQHQANEKLRKLVYAGAEKRYGEMRIKSEKLKVKNWLPNQASQAIRNGDIPKVSSQQLSAHPINKVKNRIEYELSLITQKGFAPYFLVVQDIVKQTKSTIGRGSGAASIVSYCLFITQVDPICYNLQFERFIHPERVDMPDIDVDFPWDERDDILEFIFQKYGIERTAMVSNQVCLKPRSAVRETAKVYGLSNEEILAVTKRIGWYVKRSDLLQWVKTDSRFKNVDMDETLETVLKYSGKIIGAFHMSSVHPGGIILVPDEIRKYVPVLTAPKGVQIVEWEKDQVEDSGLLKIDILGNRSLAVVRDTLKQIGLYRNQYMDYHQIQPIGDNKTEALMKSGRTMGIFYIESPATRQLLAKAGVVDFEHVVIYSSIIRPAANRYTNLMLERIHGKPWELLHPDLEFLRESYGIMVYEEQVSTTARVIGGFGYAESDYIRKVISRPALEHLIPKWKQKFVNGALKRGYTQKLADALWGMIQSFSGYSFCKPHSASYAMLSFTCAYLKAHYPAEFLASVISNQGGFYSTYAYLSEARRFGITILLPDINLSNREYKGRKNKIRMGLMAIRNLQQKILVTILEERKVGNFQSLDDFLQRVNPDMSDGIALTNAGCFRDLEPNLTHREIAYRVALYCMEESRSETGMLDAPDNTTAIPPSLTNGDLSHQELIQLERESFGFPISEHPLNKYQPLLQGKIIKAEDIPRFVNQTVRLAGVLITRKVTSTRQKEPMEFVTFEDETDIYEGVMFPEAFKQYGDLLNWETLFILRGKIEEAFGVFTVTIENLSSLQKLSGSTRQRSDNIKKIKQGKKSLNQLFTSPGNSLQLRNTGIAK